MDRLTKTDFLKTAFEPLIMRGEIAESNIRRDDAYGDIELRSLEQRSPYNFVRRVPSTDFDSLCLTQYDLIAGKTSWEYGLEDNIGVPQVVYGTNDDVPMVELTFNKESTPIIKIEMGLSITYEELNAISAASFNEYGGNLLETKMSALMNKMDEKAKNIGFYGVKGQTSVPGLLSNPNVDLAPSAFDFYASTNATEIAEEFCKYFYQVWETSNSVEKPDTIVVPLSFHRFLTTTRSSTGYNRTALSLIKETFDTMDVDIIPKFELGADNLESNGVLAPGTDRDMFIVYKRKINEADVHGQLYPNLERHCTPYYSFPFEYTNRRYITSVRQNLTGVIFSFAGSALRVTFPREV